MRYLYVAVLLGMLISLPRNAYAIGQGSDKAAGLRPNKDIYGNSYKNSKNLFKDKDKNGVRNIFQKRDRRQAKKNKNRR